MEIKIPSFEFEDTINFIKYLHEIDTTNVEKIKLIFDVDWVYPYCMVLCSSALKKLKERNENMDIEVVISDKDAVSYAGHMGFFKYISESIEVGNMPGEASGGDNYIPITVLDLAAYTTAYIREDCTRDENEAIESKAEELAKVLCFDEGEILEFFEYCIKEILRNIREHSESNKAIVCAQHYRDGRAEIAILDEGIGIKNSLGKNDCYSDDIKDDLDALKYAIKPGVSKAFSVKDDNKPRGIWANSGYGMWITSEFCKRLNGKFRIASGKKALQISPDSIEDYDTFFDGTAIGISFDITELEDYKSMLNEIRKQGQVKAKEFKKAFKEASVASRGIVKINDK